MATLKSELLVRLIDGVSRPARAASAALRGLNAAAAGAGSGASLIAMQNRVTKAMERNSQAIGVMQNKFYGAATAGYFLHRSITPTIRTAMDFETVLEDLGQKADLAGKPLQDIGKRIREIGRQTRQGALKVGRGVDFLVGMGLGGKTDAENVEAAVGMAPAIGKTAHAYRAEIEDLAKAAHAVFLNLKVPAEKVQFAFDVMAKSGKLGGFELKNMAKWFPSLTASAEALRMSGAGAIADISAALQVARKGAANGDEAANNLANFFQKLTIKETLRNFSKFGVDVFKELDYARKKGLSPIEHIINVLRKVTKDNPDMIAQIFGDMQVLKFLRPMWANMDEYRRIRAESLKAQGMVEEDFARRLGTYWSKLQKFLSAMESLSITLGNALLPGFTMLIDKLGAVAGLFERFSETHPQIASGLVGIAAAMIALRVAALVTGISGRVAMNGLLLMAAGGLRTLRVMKALVAVPFAAMARGLAGLWQTMAMRTALATAAAGRAPGVFARLADAFLVLGRGMRRVPGSMLRSFVGMLTGLGPAGWAAAAAIGALAWGAAFVAKNFDKLSSFGGGFFDGLMEGLKPLGENLRPVADLVGRIGSAVSSLIPDLSGSNEEWAKWGKTVGGQVAEAVNAVADAISAVVGWIGDAITKAWELGKAIGSWVGGGSPASGSAAPAAAPARARGGRVSRGTSYLVGERRPEIFTPGASGHITPRVPESGSSRAAPTMNFSPTINVSGVIGQHREIVDLIERELSRRMEEYFHGVQGDVGLGWS